MASIDRQLVDVAIEEIQRVYDLPQGLCDALKKNILKRVLLYEGVDLPDTKETKVIKNIDSLVLFFLNRLLNNIRDYDIEKDVNVRGNKGSYTSFYQRLDLKSKESIARMVTSKLREKVGTVDKSLVLNATDKVFDHEVGHALQTYFTGAVGTNDLKFKTLLDDLNHEYPRYFYNYNELGMDSLTKYHTGLKVMRRNDEEYQARSFYAPSAYTTHLDEIFNEDEALEVTGINTPQLNYKFGHVFDKKIYNYDSSNYRITSYARMMKLIIGKNQTFEAMYVDPISLYIKFDNFEEEAHDVFDINETSNLTPMMRVLLRLDTVRNSKIDSNVIPQAYELDLFFTKCFSRTIKDRLNNVSSIDELDQLEGGVKEFKGCLMTSDHQNLLTHRLCENMLNAIAIRKNAFVNPEYKSDNGEAYQEFVQIGDDICMALEEEDEERYKELWEKLDTCEQQISKVPISAFKKSQTDMSYDEKVQFILANMKKALNNRRGDAYHYYRSNLMQIMSGKIIDVTTTPKF